MSIDKALIQQAIGLGYEDAKRTFKGISKYALQKGVAFNNLNRHFVGEKRKKLR